MSYFIRFLLVFVVLYSGANAGEIVAEVNDSDFMNKGFAEAHLSVHLTENGQPVANVETVWEVIAVNNNSLAMADGYKHKISGLSWDKPVPGRNTAVEAKTANTDSNGKAGIILTDSPFMTLLPAQ